MHKLKRLMTALVVVTMAFAASTAPALAEPGGEPKSLGEVVSNLQNWVMGILAAVATLFVVIGGFRYVVSGGDPGQVEKAKLAFRGALAGYAVAALAPVIIAVLRSIVGA